MIMSVNLLRHRS